MSTFLLEIDALGSYSGGNAPLMEILIGGAVISSSSVSTSASTYSFLIDYSGNYPSSLSFRFNGGSGDPGDSITLNAVRVNGQNVSTSNLSSLLMTQGSSSNVTGVNHLYGRTEPTSGDLGTVTVTGTGGADNLQGGDSVNGDVLDAGGGDDRVIGLGSDDAIIGGDGNDRLFGDGGNDIIIGGAGADRIFGNDGDDFLHGGADNDRLVGGAGNDILNGGAGDDGLLGEAGNDILFGEAGNDFLIGDDGNDILYGDDGNDNISGGNGNDIIYGGNGDDKIDAGAGDDIIYNGAGSDVISGGAGTDLFDATATSAGIDIDMLNQVINNNGSGDTGIIGMIENVDATGYDDTVIGNDSDNIINGFAGNDTIEGSGGNDTINGGDGNDILYAGSSGGSLQSQIDAILAANPGVVYSSATGNFYQQVTTNYTWDQANTNAQNSLINGVAGHLAVITSAAENAFVAGIISGDSWLGGSDATTEGNWLWVGGPDAGQMFWQGDAGGSAQNGYYENWNGGEPNNSGNEDAIEMNTGGGWNDQGAGGAQDSVIEWEGTSLLTLASDDTGTTNTLDGGAGNDQMYGAEGIDIFYGRSGNDTISGGDANDQIYGGTGTDTLDGDDGDDFIDGEEDNDVINGGAGNDTIYGGAGNDTINGDYDAALIVSTPGWRYEYYNLAGTPNTLATAGFTVNGGRDNSNTATSTGITQNTDPAGFDTGDDFALKFETTLTITVAGTYTFRTRSDDGSALFLDGVQIVNNDGLHGATTVTSAGQSLAAGTYTLEATFFERGGGQVMLVEMAGPDTGGGYVDMGPYAGVAYQTAPDANGDDILYGGDGDDTLYGGAGDDTIDGGNGTDTAIFTGDFADYVITLDGSVYTLIDQRTGAGTDGTDMVTNVQNYSFADGIVDVSSLLNTPPTVVTGTAGNDTLYSSSVPPGSNSYIQAILDNNPRPITGGGGTQDLLYNSDTGNFYQFVRNFESVAAMNSKIAAGTIDGVAGTLVAFETAAEKTWVLANMGADYGGGPSFENNTIVGDTNLADSQQTTLNANGTFGTSGGWRPYIVEWDGDAILGANNNPGSGDPYILNGGDGADQLYGADGIDTFVFENAYVDHVDVIHNFDKDDADILDISNILSDQGITVNAGNIAQYVMVNQYNGLRVDPTGSGQFYASGDNLIATFSGSTDVQDAATMLANGTLLV